MHVWGLPDTYMMMGSRIFPHLIRHRLCTDEMPLLLDVPIMSLKKAGMLFFPPSSNETLTGVRI